MIAPNHVHSMYSYLDGLSTPEEIALRCKEIGAASCTLTDHGMVAGHLHFAKAMKAQGIKPVLGCELYHGTRTGPFKRNERDAAHLIALAMGDEGLRNLWRLVDATADEKHFFHVGRVFKEDLAKYKAGIVFTSGCGLGLVPQGLVKGDNTWLNWYLDTFKDNFFLELSTYPGDIIFKDRDDPEATTTTRLYNELLVDVGMERGIPFTYGDDGHYAFPSQWPQHDLYLALQMRQDIFTSIEDRKMYHPPDAVVIKDEVMVRESLSYLPQSVVDEAIANAVDLGAVSAANFPYDGKRHMPMFVPSECPWLSKAQQRRSPEDLFLDMVEVGIREKYGEKPAQEVWDRTLYECETLLNDGIHHYFLMGWDEMQIADHLGIERGPGRGSSAGCIVAYALGITDVDPLHYGLIFERFWNSGRADGFPDIDSDFSQERRDEIIEYLKDRYGRDKVRAIGNVGYFKPKAAIDRLSKGCGISFEEAEELKDIVDGTHDLEIHGVDQIGWNPEIDPGKVIYVKDDVGEQIDEWILADPKRTKLRRGFVNMCELISSRVEKYGVHASGIVISDVPLADQLPAYMRGSEDRRIPATLFAMDDVDKLHFIKLDVLGLRTLDTLDHWHKLIAEKGIDIKWSGLDKQHHPDGMWDLLHQGFAAGIFQVERGYPKHLCERMDARSVEDLGVIVALNRPGPIRAGVPDKYLARRTGEEEVSYIDKRFRELAGTVMDPTFGLFVYQEQIISYFNALGYTLSESDYMRKIMGKKKPEELAMVYTGENDFKGRGYEEMAWKAGIKEDAAISVWQDIEGFASYCFNKSHAIAYAILGFRCLFAKYYAPAQFYAACLRTVENKKRTNMMPLYINEARRMKIGVYPPDIERSSALTTVADDGSIYFGFRDVKGLDKSAPYIVEFRDELGFDISSPDAFNAQLEDVNTRFLADRKARQEQGLPRIEGKSPKQKLGAGKIQAILDAGAWERLAPSGLSLTNKQKLEETRLEVILTDNSAEILERNAKVVEKCNDFAKMILPWRDKVGDIYDPDAYLIYDVCGIVSGVVEQRAKKSGNRFGLVTIDYEQYTSEFIVFSKLWKANKFLFRLRNVCVFTIKQAPPNQYGESYSFQFGYKLK